MTSNPRWKIAERRIATALQKAAGRVRDPKLAPLCTSTGRVGHLTELGFDVLAGNPEDGTALVGECKRRKSFFVAEAFRALLQIIRIGHEWERTPVMGISLSDDVPAFIETARGKYRIPRDWVLMPLGFAEELLKAKRDQNCEGSPLCITAEEIDAEWEALRREGYLK